MQLDVVKNAKRNLIFGCINKMVVLLCPFVERFVIQGVLGAQYLGLDSLYASLISVLSLSELGFSAAMVYNMYKPMAEGNVEKMNALLNFYKKVYRIIGFVILGAGLLMIPFLSNFINGLYPTDINLVKLYLIYLANAVLSYFMFAYLSSLIVVYQRDDVNSTINSVVKSGLMVSKVALLVLTRNYYLFSIMMPVFTILNNLLIAWRVRVLFPQYKAVGYLSGKDKAGIRKLVVGTFIQQACSVTRNSLDSICVSAFIGLTLTAIYNNYYLIITGIISFASIVTASFMGGIGNHVTTRSVEENYQEMKILDFVYLWLCGWCMICLLCLFQPFMKIWMGKDMQLPMSAVIMLCLYFYLLKLGDIRSMYSSANGLWWQQRYRALCETLLNLILNLALGKIFGIHGIILATMISLFLCNYLWSVGITFRLYFSISKRRDYYIYQGKQTFLIFIVAALTYFICLKVTKEGDLMQLLIRGIVCIILPNSIFYFVYRKTKQFQYAKRIIMRR